MPLTPREAFRIGFVMRCADEGLTGEQVRERVEKAAALVEKRGGPLSALGGLAGHAGGLLLAAPLAAGVGGGYLAHKMVEDSVDEDDVRQQELIAELKHWARRAREQRKMRALAPG